MNLWAALWWQRGSIDGDIEENYGYIKTRPNLRQYPYGWRLPKPIKVTITKPCTP